MTGRVRIGIAVMVLGVIAAVIGIIVGFVPVQDVGSACGTAFSPSEQPGFSLAGLLIDNYCHQKLASFVATAWTLIVIGGVALVAGLIATLVPGRGPAPARPVSPPVRSDA